MTPDKTPADRLAEAFSKRNKENQALGLGCNTKGFSYGCYKDGWNDALTDYRASKNEGQVTAAIKKYFPDASKVEDDELVEQLREMFEHYQTVNNSFEANHAKAPHSDDIIELDEPVFKDRQDALQAAITRLQSQSANPWVKIEDPIVESWKDGRDIDLLVATDALTPHRVTDCAFIAGVWKYKHLGRGMRVILEEFDDDPIVKITHAMLPIAPPKTEE